MNLIILHGNGLSALSQKLSQIKKNFDPLAVTTFNSNQIDLASALIEFSTPQLFSKERLIILENFDMQIDFNLLPQDDDLTVVFLFNKNLPANSSLLKDALKLKAQIFEFSEAEERNIFPFLDGLAEKNDKSFLMFEKLYKNFGSQYLLTMIFFMLRRFILTPTNLPGFVLAKLQKQKQNFPHPKITAVYKEMLEADFKIKNGLVEEKAALTLLLNNFF